MARTRTKKTHGGRRTGAGRPKLSPGEETVMMTFKVPAGLAEKLDGYAERHDLPNRSEAFRRILERLRT